MQFAYHGDKVHFYSDLIHGTIIIKILKIAYILVGLLKKAISFFFFSTFNTFKKILMLIFVSHFLVLNKSCINHFWANFPIFSVLLVFAFFFKKKKKERNFPCVRASLGQAAWHHTFLCFFSQPKAYP